MKIPHRLRRPWLSLLAGATTLGLVFPASGQEYDDYYDEEWYDPSDWFDGDDSDVDGWEAYEYDSGWNEYAWNPAWDYDYNYGDYDSYVTETSGSEDDRNWNTASNRNRQQDAASNRDREQTRSDGNRDRNREGDDRTTARQRSDSSKDQSGRERADERPRDFQYNQETGTWEVEDEVFYNSYAYYPYNYAYIITYEPTGFETQDATGSDRGRASTHRSSRDRQQGEEGRTGFRGDQQMNRETHQFKGSIEAFRHTELADREGRTDTYSLAKVKLDNGRSVVFSLGEKNRLQDLDLEQGDQITILGSTGQIGNRKIIIAQRVKAKGKSVDVNGRVARVSDPTHRSQANRWGEETMARGENQRMDRDRNRSAQGQKSDRQETAERMTLSGTVAEFQSARVEGSRERQSFVRIELENGRSATVLLGTDTSLSDLELSEGDQVRILGTRDQIDGKTVLRAQSLRIEGDPVKLSAR